MMILKGMRNVARFWTGNNGEDSTMRLKDDAPVTAPETAQADSTVQSVPHISMAVLAREALRLLVNEFEDIKHRVLAEPSNYDELLECLDYNDSDVIVIPNGSAFRVLKRGTWIDCLRLRKGHDLQGKATRLISQSCEVLINKSLDDAAESMKTAIKFIGNEIKRINPDRIVDVPFREGISSAYRSRYPDAGVSILMESGPKPNEFTFIVGIVE